jgi:hypothetical protein
LLLEARKGQAGVRADPRSERLVVCPGLGRDECTDHDDAKPIDPSIRHVADLAFAESGCPTSALP